MRRILAAAAALLMLTGCADPVGQADSAVPAMAEPTEAPTTEAPTEPPTEPPTQPPTKAELRLSQMSLHQKVCQLFIVVPEALAGHDVLSWSDDQNMLSYAEYPVGGFIFFAKNMTSQEQLSALISEMQSSAMEQGIGAFMGVDEEGGSVARVSQSLGTAAVDSMRWIGESGDPERAKAAGETIGGYLSELGFSLDFAPVADVNLSWENELGNRIFSEDPNTVAEMSAAVVEGLHENGICATLKHFPGLGAGSGNTHYGTVVIDRTYEQLKEVEFTAFGGGIAAGADFVMVGHQITTGSGQELPGDMSPVVVTDWLRGDLGFEGIAVTDSHSMGAVAGVYPPGQAAVMSISAGIDIILMPADLPAAVSGVEDAVSSGALSEERIDESVLRILEKKEALGLL
ncbi:MAG: glycoside hydrolase family 3 protein [Ruminococcus sp.]|nr:glycoside hydrolase family 3 protein [Ruminococcus sp.]